MPRCASALLRASIPSPLLLSERCCCPQYSQFPMNPRLLWWNKYPWNKTRFWCARKIREKRRHSGCDFLAGSIQALQTAASSDRTACFTPADEVQRRRNRDRILLHWACHQYESKRSQCNWNQSVVYGCAYIYIYNKNINLIYNNTILFRNQRCLCHICWLKSYNAFSFSNFIIIDSYNIVADMLNVSPPPIPYWKILEQ